MTQPNEKDRERAREIVKTYHAMPMATWLYCEELIAQALAEAEARGREQERQETNSLIAQRERFYLAEITKARADERERALEEAAILCDTHATGWRGDRGQQVGDWGATGKSIASGLVDASKNIRALKEKS